MEYITYHRLKTKEGRFSEISKNRALLMLISQTVKPGQYRPVLIPSYSAKAMVKRVHPNEKQALHPRNRHRGRYDFRLLIQSCPPLAEYVKVNAYNDESVDFSDPEAVKMLNKALLIHFYGIKNWDIPPGYLCPPIPGRAEYIHQMAGLLASCCQEKIPSGPLIKVLDIGVGANCVYPLIGTTEYGWSFTGSDTDPVSIASAQKIIDQNPELKDRIGLRFQPDPKDIFHGIIQKGEHFDLTICNPPFHESLSAARSGTLRKLNHLTSRKVSEPVLNFGGGHGELICDGGEIRFVSVMIGQSSQFSTSCFWYSTLISKESNLRVVYKELKKVGAADIRTLPITTGNKISRIVAWTFLTLRQREVWIKTRWRTFL